MNAPALPIEDILATSPFPPPAGRVLGHSRRGVGIEGYRFGRGELHVSLIAGCHADEPVGPAMLRRAGGAPPPAAGGGRPRPAGPPPPRGRSRWGRPCCGGWPPSSPSGRRTIPCSWRPPGSSFPTSIRTARSATRGGARR